jgi:hypothetical protein
MKMNADYQTLKSRRDAERVEMEKIAPEPKTFLGRFVPFSFVGRDKADIYRKQLHAATKISMSTLVNVAGVVGWEKLINGIHKIQSPAVTRKAEKIAREHGFTGEKTIDAMATTGVYAMGAGFDRHTYTVITDSHGEGYADWCPQTEALQEMELFDEAGELHHWCDAMDRAIMAGACKDSFYLHTHCPGAGDRYCRWVIKDEDEKRWNTDNPYQVLKELKAERREYIEEKEPEPIKIKPLGSAYLMEKTPAEIALAGAKTKFSIATEVLFTCAHLLGWEKLINLVSKKQSLGFTKAALERKREFDIDGNSLRDAATMAPMGYTGVFDTHTINQYTEDRIEGVGKSCPMVDAAKEMGLENDIEDLSLWCDFYHNFNVHAVNEDFNLTHTHCLGRGDKHCRFVIK